MQEARPRRLGERTVDYGLAAMDFCGTLPRTAAGRHVAACGRIVPATVSPDERSEESPKAMSIRGAISAQSGRSWRASWTFRRRPGRIHRARPSFL